MSAYYCPYCNSDKITEYTTYFKCKKCKLSFDTRNFEAFEDKSDLLSLEEVNAIASVLKKHIYTDKI